MPEYFDALYHSDAVIGLNTSALIEAGVVGRPVLSIVHPDYARNQEGTLHWPYLQEVGGGLLRTAHGFDEHLAQLADMVAGAEDGTVDAAGFVRAFVRPFGTDTPATPLLAEGIEGLGSAGPARPVRVSLWAYVPRPLLFPLIWFRLLRGEWKTLSKKSRRAMKRGVQNSKRNLRQFLKRLVLKRVRTEQPRVVLPKAERARHRAQNLFDSVEEVEDTKEALTRLARSGKTILVGPWLSETGFELLYWIPFLNWAKSYGNFRDDRLIVVSRGGCASWYRHITPNYRDVFDFYTPDEFRSRNEQRIVQQGGLLKHVGVADFDREILDRVRRAAGTNETELLHPSLMYKLFRVFWRLQASVGLVEGFTIHGRIERPALGDLANHLPPDYIAVKFYANNSFPDTPSNRTFVTSYLNQLAVHHDLVLLTTGVRFDDHDDFEPTRRERVHTVDHLMTPRDNLDVQTRVIAASKAFVGTYGGFSYLAPLLGVDTLAFFSDGAGFRIDHLEIAKRVFTDLHSASFIPLDAQDLEVLRIGLGVGDGAQLPVSSRLGMKFLVCARHFGYLRNFESVLVELAERGHVLHLTADREERSGGLEMVQRLAARYPRVSVGWTPPRERDDWLHVATEIRQSQDYLRFLNRAYNRTPMLRRRSKDRTPPTTVWLVEQAGFRFRPGRLLLSAILKLLEASLPLHEPYTSFLREQAPDVVMLTPLIDLGSPQLDMLKSARALGLRSVLGVGSWDHLSSKALIRILPDMIAVWNDVQRHEALTMHDVPEDRVTVTGAQCYDQWFGRAPSRSRESFCRAVGLPSDRPFVLYVCSSPFRGSPPEAEFAMRWIRAVRGCSDERLSDVGILVRPHPGRLKGWHGRDLSAADVTLHGGNPIDDVARNDYFDALHYCAAVVGLNTSAFLEASVAGRPVLAVLPREYWKSQEGTLHFKYLTEVGGGLLTTSRSLDEHLPQLAAAVSGEMRVDHRAFLRAFIRPFGLDEPATPRFANTLERVARAPAPPPAVRDAVGRIVRPLLTARLSARRTRTWWRRTRKDARHDLRKTRGRALRTFRRPLKWGERVLGRGGRATLARNDAADADATARHHEAAAEAQQAVTAMRGSGRLILAGPWVSETGFELLYWIPFLRWAQKYGHLRASRIVAMSRGGTAAWYDEIASRYVDVFDVVPVEEFRRANERRIVLQDGQKHYAVTSFDEEVARRVAARLDLRRYDWLHPGLMYSLFRRYWMQLAPASLVRAFSVPRAIRVQAGEPVAGLPPRYIAVKFYANQALPSGPENRQFVASVLRRLTSRGHVVLLDTGLALDDHDEYGSGGAAERVHTVEHLMSPRTNLDVQTRIIAGADALVATYGGFSYLGPLLGVRTLALYSNPAGFRVDHLEVAQRTFRALGAAPFVPVRSHDLRMLEGLLGNEPMACAG